MLTRIVITNLTFYWHKTLTVILLSALLFFMVFATLGFTLHIQKTADRSLASLHTEIIMQKDEAEKNPLEIDTQGVIFPFNIQSFSIDPVQQVLLGIAEIKGFSSALVLWQFDIQNNRSLVAINIDDPMVGLRKEIEDLIMPGGNFFTGNSDQSVLLERHFAQLFGYKLGKTYRIGWTDYSISGIVDFKEESNLVNAQVFLPYRTALNIISSEKSVINQIYISLDSAASMQRVREKINALLPGFSLITKDRLLNNLSAFNKLIYQFGIFFASVVLIVVLVLVFFILKMLNLEMKNQLLVLKTIGWPRKAILSWRMIETGSIIISSLCLSLLLFLLFNNVIILNTHLGSLLDQGFKL